MAALQPPPIAAYTPMSEDGFLELGLSLRSNTGAARWRNTQRETQIEDFRSNYVAHPRALSVLWDLLHTAPYADCRIPDCVDPSHLLLVYRWLKSTERERKN